MKKKNKLFIFLILLLIIAGGGYYYYYQAKNGAVPYTLEKVQRQNIAQTVSVTGTVESDPRIEMQFQKNGKIGNIYVKEGQQVEKNKNLASLDNEDLAIQINAASSNLKFYQSKLDQELEGAEKEKIALAQIAVDKTKQDLTSAETSLVDLQKVNQEKAAEAELNLEKSRLNLDYMNKKAIEDIKSAEQKVSDAKVSLDNSDTNITDIAKTAEQTLADAYSDIEPVMQSSLITVSNNLAAVNNIIGVDGGSIVNAQTVTIGAKDSASVGAAQESYKKAKAVYAATQEIFNAWQMTKNKDEIKAVEIQILQSLNTAKIALDDTYKTLETAVVTSQLGLTNDLKGFKDLIAAQQSANSAGVVNLNNAYQSIETAKIAKDTNVNTAESAKDTKQSAYNDAVSNLAQVKITSDNNIKNAEIGLSQAEQNLKQTKVTSSKQENDLTSEINLKKIAVQNTEASLTDLTAPPRKVDLKSLEANVQKAQNDLAAAQYNYNQTILKTPVNGIVVDIKKDIGENITANEIFMVLDSQKLLIKANVSETDISKIKLNDKVTMTFDALDFSDEFTGQVVELSPAETIIEGVVYYQVKISFEAKEGKDIRAGMTANMKIHTAEKEKVIAIPLRAVKYQDEKRYVQVVVNNELKDKEIITGLEGDQYVEVLSGLEEEEEIVTFVKQEYSLTSK